MSTGRFSSWFLTKNGRRFVHSSVRIIGISFVSLHFIPHTLLLDKYVDIVHLYDSGLKEKLSEELEKKFQHCLNVLDSSDFQKKYLKPFSVFGFNLFNAGSTHSRFGAFIGIPPNFNFKSEDDIDKSKIQLNTESVDWNSPAATKLADSLILSENAKTFGICREILMSQTHKIYLETLYPAGILIFIYYINMKVSKHLNLIQKPPMFRYTLYTLSSLFGIGCYFLSRDSTRIHYETEVDQALCKLGPDYVKAGVEFYSKAIERNIALRELLGDTGKSAFTVKGNENSLIRTKTLPLTIRKSFFEIKLEEMENEQKEESDKSE